MNLYQLDKQSTKFTIWKYWKSCVKKLDGNDPNFLPTTHGSCITTMHLLTRHCLWGFFAAKQITVWEQTAYSLHLAPRGFILFQKIKKILIGKHFYDNDDIRNNTTAALKAMPQNQFQTCFEGWTRHWHWCISFPRGVLWRWPWWYSAMRHVALLPRRVHELYCLTMYYIREKIFKPLFYVMVRSLWGTFYKLSL